MNQKAAKATVYVSAIFSVVVLINAWMLGWQFWGTWKAFAAAFCGAVYGMLGAGLDHENLRFRAPAVEPMTADRWAYMFVRGSMATALGMGAAYVSNGLLIERKLAEETFWIIAFAAAYLFDVSKLNPAK